MAPLLFEWRGFFVIEMVFVDYPKKIKKKMRYNKLPQIFSILTISLAGVVFSPALVFPVSPPDCTDLIGCERKFCEIEKQIVIAQEVGNTHKVEGLEKALKEALDNCTNKGLIEELMGKILEAKEDLAEHEADLREAEADEKQDKIVKYREKIVEDTNKIKRLEDELSVLENASNHKSASE